jgi:hypothetical protein
MSTEIEPPTASTSSLLTDGIDADDFLATPTSKLWITLDKPTTVVHARTVGMHAHVNRR